MHLTLDSKSQKLITKRLKSGKYTTPEEVITAALHALEQDETAGDFKPGEWDILLAEGEATKALDGQTVLAELRDLRRKSKRK